MPPKGKAAGKAAGKAKAKANGGRGRGRGRASAEDETEGPDSEFNGEPSATETGESAEGEAMPNNIPNLPKAP
eukprot:10041420-Alexandrium_andersonii.AAC.1